MIVKILGGSATRLPFPVRKYVKMAKRKASSAKIVESTLLTIERSMLLAPVMGLIAQDGCSPR